MAKIKGEALLWRMGSQPTFEKSVSEAITRYRMRFGVMPTLVLANPAEVPAAGMVVDGVPVMSDKETLIRHLYVGIAE